MSVIYITEETRFRSAEEYVAFISSHEQVHYDIRAVFTDDCVIAAEKLLTRRSIFGRRSAAEHIAYSLCGDAADFSLRFVLWTHTNAYMLDTGSIVMSLCFMYTSSGKRVFKVLMHEIAHILLRMHCADYEALLQLDREFLRRYGNELRALSPVEYFATCIQCSLTEQIAEEADRRVRVLCRDITDEERRKLNVKYRQLTENR